MTPAVAVCVVEVGHPLGTPATWVNELLPSLVVCDRHRSQYDERPDLGPYRWTPYSARTDGPVDAPCLRCAVRPSERHLYVPERLCDECRRAPYSGREGTR